MSFSHFQDPKFEMQLQADGSITYKNMPKCPNDFSILFEISYTNRKRPIRISTLYEGSSGKIATVNLKDDSIKAVTCYHQSDYNGQLITIGQTLKLEQPEQKAQRRPG